MRLLLLAAALCLRLPSCHATLFPRSIYDSCVESRNENFTHALEPVPGVDASAFFTMTNLEDASSCLGRVPHPVNPAFEALGWVNCSAADNVVQVRYNSTTAPLLAESESSTLYTHLRFTVTAIRGPLAEALGAYYSIFGFALYDAAGNAVKIRKQASKRIARLTRSIQTFRKRYHHAQCSRRRKQRRVDSAAWHDTVRRQPEQPSRFRLAGHVRGTMRRAIRLWHV